VRKVYAHSKARAIGGKVALQRGPIVYCFEQVDNGGQLSSVALKQDGRISETVENEVLGGIISLLVDGTRRDSLDEALYSFEKPNIRELQLKAVPYYAWGNRSEGEMTVWIREE